MRLALHSLWPVWAGVSLVKKEMASLMRAPTLSDRSMKFNFPDNQGDDEPKRSLPKPNAKMKLSGSGLSFTEEEVRGLIANPVYAGVGPFRAVSADPRSSDLPLARLDGASAQIRSKAGNDEGGFESVHDI